MIEQKQAVVDSIHAIVESSNETVNSMLDTVESRQYNEAFTQSKNYEVILDLKVESEHLKLQVVKKIKDLKEINIIKDSFLESPINSHSTNRPNNSELYLEQILYLQKELKVKTI